MRRLSVWNLIGMVSIAASGCCIHLEPRPFAAIIADTILFDDFPNDTTVIFIDVTEDDGIIAYVVETEYERREFLRDSALSRPWPEYWPDRISGGDCREVAMRLRPYVRKYYAEGRQVVVSPRVVRPFIELLDSLREDGANVILVPHGPLLDYLLKE